MQSAKTKNCNSNLSGMVKKNVEKGENILRKEELVTAIGCSNWQNRKIVWKYKNLSERIDNIIIYWLCQVKNRNLQHLLVAPGGGVLQPFMSLWYKKDLLFTQNGASFSEKCLCTNPCSPPHFLGRVDPCQGCWADSGLRDADHWPNETLSNWPHFWDGFDEHVVLVTLYIYIYIFVYAHI